LLLLLIVCWPGYSDGAVVVCVWDRGVQSMVQI
jgi:hypothetical protein